MILFAISQYYYPENKFVRVYLINPEWLNKYEYIKIKSLIDNKINDIIKNLTLSYNINSISTIIPYLNNDTLSNCDKIMGNNYQIPRMATSEQIFLKDKYITIYRNFIIMNENIFNLFKKYFNMNPANDEIYYTYKKNKEDLVALKNQVIYDPQNQNNYQSLVLGGIIDRKKNYFDIQHIFDYNKKENLDREINIFSQLDIPSYISTKTDLTF